MSFQTKPNISLDNRRPKTYFDCKDAVDEENVKYAIRRLIGKIWEVCPDKPEKIEEIKRILIS